MDPSDTSKLLHMQASLLLSKSLAPHHSAVLQVHAIHNQKATPQETAGVAVTNFTEPGLSVITHQSAAQQTPSNGLSKGRADVNGGKQHHSEEHHQALTTLSALWPADTPIDEAFLASILDTQCHGDLEVKNPCLCHPPALRHITDHIASMCCLRGKRP